MKKIILGLIALLSFTACNKHDFEVITTQEAVTAKYNDVFIKTFGAPAANQDWGFGTDDYPITRGYDANANNWAQNGYTVPLKVTDAERAKVIEYFSIERKTDVTEQVDWSDFFVQQVYKGNSTYTAKNNGGIGKGSDHMDYLTCGMNDEHIYNFNGGHGSNTYVNYAYVEIPNVDKNNWKKYWNDEISLMVNSSTARFGYHNTTDSKQHHEYLLAIIDGAYYVGFDFYANGDNTNQQVDRDYVYNDWIVKISPGKDQPKPAVRIICEDLNANNGSDFDFNDVVFDATYETNGKTTVTVLAAGGTLPLFVGGKEVHELFGVSTSTMVNTNNGTVSKNPQSFTIDRVIAPWDIEVVVMKENELIPLKANVGEPAAKIAVSPNFIWCNEREDIKTKYPNFTEYVKNISVNWY